MQLAKAFVAQVLGLLLAWAAARAGFVSQFPLLVGLQAIAAVLASRMLRQPVWWRYIHLTFAPAVIGLIALQLPAWIYLLAAIALGLVFWGTVKGDVPLFLSSIEVTDAIADIVKREQAGVFIDLGAGVGTVTIPLAQRYPRMVVEAWENAPIPWLTCASRSQSLPNVLVYRKSFWECDLSIFDVVYAFLSPAVMSRLGIKALREMRPGSLLVSSSFPIPDWEPESVVTIKDRLGTRLYCYRIQQ